MRRGAWYAAYSRLADIASWRESVAASTRNELTAKLKAIAFPDTAWPEVYTGIARDCGKIAQILSHGSRWNYEELLLLLTLRAAVATVLGYLSDTVPPVARDLDRESAAAHELEAIDDDLRQLCQDAAHQSDFLLSIAQIRKNSGVSPIYLERLFEKYRGDPGSSII